MIRSLLFGLTLFLISFIHLYSQSNCKQYGGNHIDYAFDMIQDPIGNYVITGRSYSFLLDTNDFWGDIYTVKLDASHQLLWTSVFQTAYEDEAGSIVNGTDGGYLIAGDAYSFTGGYDLSLVKLDNSGNLSWSKLFGTPIDEKANVICSTSDNGYVLGGYVDSVFPGSVQIYIPLVVKINSSGTVLWAKKIGYPSGTFGGSAYDVKETNDGNILVTGDIIRFNQGPEDSDLFLASFSSSGNLNWFKWIGDNCVNCHEMGAKLLEKDSITYTVAASYAPGSGVYLVNFNVSGNILSEHIVQTGNFPYTNISMTGTTDHGLIIACPALQISVFKLDSLDQMDWSASYGDGTTPNNTPCNIVNNGPNYKLSGYTGSTGPYREDYLMMDLDASGNSCCKLSDLSLSINTVDKIDSSGAVTWDVVFTETTDGSITTGGVQNNICPVGMGVDQNNSSVFQVYPNPSTGNFYVSTEIPVKNASIFIMNMYGEILTSFNQVDISSPFFIDLQLASGSYIMTILHSTGNFHHKLVID